MEPARLCRALLLVLLAACTLERGLVAGEPPVCQAGGSRAAGGGSPGGAADAAGTLAAGAAAAAGAGGGGRPKTCIYAIALNERKHVESFMAACKGADLVLVADTGSTDGTPEALRAAGATVHSITVQPWRFDAARNRALALLPADCGLCVSLDLDEQLQAGWAEALAGAWAESGGRATALRSWYVWSWQEDGVTPAVEFLQTKIHARWNYTWRDPAHELPYWTGAAGEERVVDAPAVRVHHHADPAKSRGSYLGLLKLGVEEDPANARRAYYYGRELMYQGQHEAAVRELERYLALPGATWREERAAALRHIAACHEALQQGGQALAAAHRGVLEWGEAREPWLALARAATQGGEHRTAYWAATSALASQPSVAFGTDAFASDGEAHDYAAFAAYNLQLYGTAVRHGEAAAALEPGDARLASDLQFYRLKAAAPADSAALAAVVEGAAAAAGAAVPAATASAAQGGADSKQRIPKILHRVFLSGRKEFRSLRGKAGSSLRPEWDDHCRLVHEQAGWRYMFWDAAAVHALVAQHYDWYLPVWANYTTTVRRGDAARYFILHRFGGLYLDLDVECYREGYDMLEGRDLVLQEDDNGGAVINAMMASVPGHPVWPLIFQVMAERAGGDVQPPRKRGVWLPPDSPLWMTGPMALTEAVRRAGVTPRLSLLVGPRHAWNGTVVQVYPQGTWYTPCWKLDATCRQLHETERWNGLIKPYLVGRHRYAATWHGKKAEDPASQGH